MMDDPRLKVEKCSLSYLATRQITAELAPIPSGGAVKFGGHVPVHLSGKEPSLGIVSDDEADHSAVTTDPATTRD